MSEVWVPDLAGRIPGLGHHRGDLLLSGRTAGAARRPQADPVWQLRHHLAGLRRRPPVRGRLWTAEFDTQIGGTVKGDQIAFTEPLNFQGQDVPITYTGTIAGDEIKFTRKVGDFATEELVAKRKKD
jgi:hypothetical protein